MHAYVSHMGLLSCLLISMEIALGSRRGSLFAGIRLVMCFKYEAPHN